MAQGTEAHTNAITHYGVLQVPPTASYETIKASYQQKARQLHPDKRLAAVAAAAAAAEGTDCNNNDGDLEQAFLLIQKAWECLRDPVSRKDYDAELALEQRNKNKSQALDVDQDLELVEDEETGDLCYVYQCRCGEEIWLRPQQQQRSSADHAEGENILYVTCDGCSLVFHVTL